MTAQHRLLAVLAADGVGYSHLMSLDDVQTVASLERARALFRRNIEAEGGRVVDTAGDSVLAVFEASASAIDAALAIQRGLADHGAAISEERRLRFRIGIHVGDIIEKSDGSVYGDGINIAARLQALGQPDAVTVSAAVLGTVAHRLRVRFEDLGEHAVKNIDEVIHAYQIWAVPVPTIAADLLPDLRIGVTRTSEESADGSPVDSRSSLSSPWATVLLEREDALRTLERAYASAQGSKGSTCLVFGEAGIGKTSLCEAFLSRFGRSVRVLRGGCEPLLSPRPLGPLYDFVAQLDDGARKDLGDLDAGSSLFSRVLESLTQQSTILVLEDLHWADVATLDLVRYLGRRVATSPILLILTYRDDELTSAHPLRQVVGDLQRSVIRIQLRSLSHSAVATLAQRSGRSADAILATTGGNPFFITELLESGGMPATVVDAVHARVARRSDAVRHLLETISSVPGRVEHWIVDELIDPEDSALHEALASGLLLSDAEGLRFRHEIARRALEQSVPTPKLKKLHSRLFDFLKAQTGGRCVPPARLVHHAKAAGRTDDVLMYAPIAAREASSRGAHREAAALYSSALEAAGSRNQQLRGHLLEAYAWESLVSDAATACIEGYEEALEVWRVSGTPIDQGRVMTRLARAYWMKCRGEDCLRINREAVRILESTPDSAEYLEALVESTRAEMCAGRNSVVFEVGARALELARSRLNNKLVGHLLISIGTAKCQAGDLDGGMALLESSLALGRSIGDEDVIGRYYINASYQLIEHRRFDAADRVISLCEKEFPPGEDSDFYYWQGTGWQTHAQLMRGRWDEAESNARRALLRYRSSSALPFRIHSLLALARVRILRGRPGFEEILQEGTQLAAGMLEPQRIAAAAIIQCELLWLRDNELGSKSQEMDSLFGWLRSLGRRAYIEELGYWLWRFGHEVTDIDSESPRGLQIAGRWREAAAAWAQIGCPLEEGQALLDGDALAIEQACTIFERLGAVPYLEKARARGGQRST